MNENFAKALNDNALDEDALRFAEITAQKGTCIKSILTDITRDISYDRERIEDYQKRLIDEPSEHFLKDYIFECECRIIARTRIYNEIAKLLQK